MLVLKKKKANAWKIVLIVAGIVLAVAAVVVAVMLWKKKRLEDKKIEEEIEAEIDAALAEEEALTADVKIGEAEEV